MARWPWQGVITPPRPFPFSEGAGGRISASGGAGPAEADAVRCRGSVALRAEWHSGAREGVPGPVRGFGGRSL